ncbi:MAG: hypothetical protein IJY65_01910 [Clostridia bacterium]|nr:hypothetical protein [Clostridia bacterium]
MKHPLPANKPSMSSDWMQAMVDKGAPSLIVGYGTRVFEFGEICLEVFEKYPKIKKHVTVYRPGSQG